MDRGTHSLTITVAEAAALLGVGRAVVQEWLKTGRLHAVRTPRRGRLRIGLASVLAEAGIPEIVITQVIGQRLASACNDARQRSESSDVGGWPDLHADIDLGALLPVSRGNAPRRSVAGSPGDEAGSWRRAIEQAAEQAAKPPPAGFEYSQRGRLIVEALPADGELVCPECGGVMELRRGRFGPYFSCSAYPDCRFRANLRAEAKAKTERMLSPAEPAHSEASQQAPRRDQQPAPTGEGGHGGRLRGRHNRVARPAGKSKPRVRAAARKRPRRVEKRRGA